MVSISEQNNKTKNITENIELKNNVHHRALFMASYAEFYNEGRVHWRLLLGRVFMEGYFPFISESLLY